MPVWLTIIRIETILKGRLNPLCLPLLPFPLSPLFSLNYSLGLVVNLLAKHGIVSFNSLYVSSVLEQHISE